MTSIEDLKKVREEKLNILKETINDLDKLIKNEFKKT